MLNPMITLAQTTTPDATWQFWVNVILTVLGIIVTVVMPLTLFVLKGVRDRLKDGDEKFERMTSQLAKFSEKFNNVENSSNRTERKLDDLVQKNNDNLMEGSGSVANLRVTIERDFVRRSEFHQFQNEMRDQNAKVLNLLMDLKKAR